MSTDPTPTRFDQLVLTITERCNLRCSYCYVPRDRSRSMTDAVAGQALAWFLGQAGELPKVSLAFIGGEPFLEPVLLRRIAEDARRQAGAHPQVAFTATTNGTVVDDEVLALVRDLDLKLAVSHDGESGQAERPFGQGEASLPTLARNLPRLRAGGDAVQLARLTVTPASVAGLAANVRSLFRHGFARVVYLPAYEADWDARAVRQWATEHDRLATWLVGRAGAGRPAPDLPTWQGIRSRLQGKARRHCGAGVRQVAVSVDGTIYPCYRAVFDPRADALALGDVSSGITRPDRLAAIADLRPGALAPGTGSCAGCEAQPGCTFFCPALAHRLTGSLSTVPDVVCALTRPQVAAARRVLAAEPRPAEGQRRPRARVAAAVAAAVLGGWLPGCARPVGVGADAGDLDAAGTDAQVTQVDARADAGDPADAYIGPGICPMEIDAGQDGGGEPDASTGCGYDYGGVC